MTAIRHPAVAGTFYPAERDALERQLALFLSEAGNEAPSPTLPKAIIGPHAGYLYSGAVAARAYARLAAARGRISRVVLIGPSHHVAFRGLAVDTAEAWAMPGGTVALDTEAIGRLRGAADGRRARRRVSARACAGGARAVPAARAGRVPPGADRCRRRAGRGGRRGVRRAVGRAGDADRGVHRPVALPRLRRVPAGRPIHRRGDRAVRSRHHADPGLRGGADARAAAGGAATGHGDRAARPAQFRRHGRPARSRRRLRRLGALRGSTRPDAETVGGRGDGSDADRAGAALDRDRVWIPADRRRSRPMPTCRHCWPRRAPRSSRSDAATGRCAAASDRRWRRGR